MKTKFSEFIKESVEEITLTIPKRYKYAILELGETCTPQEVIDEYNDIIEPEDEDALVEYKDGKFIFGDGTEQEPKDIFYVIHDYIKGE